MTESLGYSETTLNFCSCWHPGPGSQLLPDRRAWQGGHGAARTTPEPQDPPDPQHSTDSAPWSPHPHPCSPSSSFSLRGECEEEKSRLELSLHLHAAE